MIGMAFVVLSMNDDDGVGGKILKLKMECEKYEKCERKKCQEISQTSS